MNYRAHFHRTLLCIGILLFFSNAVLQTAQPPVAAPANAPQLTEAELAQLEQQMESEINSFVQSLPPEQQEQFYKDVENLTEAMSQMSEEELGSFIESVFTEPTAPEAPPAPAIAPPVKPIEKPKEEKEKPKTPKKQIDKTIKLLDEIVDHIESFLQKTIIIIDFPRKAEKWAGAGFMPQWKDPKLEWHLVGEDIIRLSQKIRSLMSCDPKTKKYRFINDLIEDKALYNNLEQVRTKLADYEPTIETPDLDLPEHDGMKLDLKSKQAIRRTIDTILEAIKLLKVPEAIDKIIAKFGPIAEQIKKEEEEAVKKALEAMRRPRIPGTVRVIGTPEGDGYTGPTHSTAASDYGYRTPSYGEYGASRSTPHSPREERERPPSSQRKPDESKKPTSEPRKPDDKKKPAVTTAAPETREEERIGKLLEQLDISLTSAVDAIDMILNTKDLNSKLKSVDQILIESFTNIRKAIKDAKKPLGGITINIKKLKGPAKTKKLKDIQEKIKKPQAKIEQLERTIAPVKEDIKVEYQIDALQTAIQKFNAEVKKMGK